MKVKICNLLRATTYIQLFAAAIALAWLSYGTLIHSDFSFRVNFFTAVIAVAILQAVYAVAVIRLMHHYAPSHKIPDVSFLRFYKVLVGLNVLIGSGILIWFGVQSVMQLQLFKQFGITDPQRSLQLCIIGSYSVVAIYTIAGTAKLKRAILQRKEWQIEIWLEEVEQLSAA